MQAKSYPESYLQATYMYKLTLVLHNAKCPYNALSLQSETYLLFKFLVVLNLVDLLQVMPTAALPASNIVQSPSPTYYVYRQ